MRDTLTQAFLFAQETTTTAEEEEGSLIDVVPGLMVWTIVTFLIVLWALRRFAFGRQGPRGGPRAARARPPRARRGEGRAGEDPRRVAPPGAAAARPGAGGRGHGPEGAAGEEPGGARGGERQASRADPPRRRRAHPARRREGDREGAGRGRPAASHRRDGGRGRRQADRERELVVPIQVIQPGFCVASTKPEVALARRQGRQPWQGRGWAPAPRDRGAEAGLHCLEGH